MEPRRQSLNLRENYFTHYVSVRFIRDSAVQVWVCKNYKCIVVFDFRKSNLDLSDLRHLLTLLKIALHVQ